MYILRTIDASGSLNAGAIPALSRLSPSNNGRMPRPLPNIINQSANEGALPPRAPIVSPKPAPKPPRK